MPDSTPPPQHHLALRLLVRLGFFFLGTVVLSFVLFWVGPYNYQLKRAYWMLIFICFIFLFVILAVGLFVQWYADKKQSGSAPEGDCRILDDEL